MAADHQHLSFRVAAVEDIAAIAEIERLSFDATAERFDEAKVRFLVGSRRVMTVVAHGGQNIVGWAAGFVWTRGAKPWGRVYALAIHPASRGRRVGPKLLQHLIEMLRKHGAESIFLEVRTDNHPAIGMYERLGFEHCQTLKHYYGPGTQAHRMLLRQGRPSPSPVFRPPQDGASCD